MDSGIRRLLLLQVLLLAVTSAVFLVIYESASALSVWYGGSIAAVNALLLARCMQRDAQMPERSPQQSLVAAYICMVQRFLVVALLFAFGMGLPALKPVALLVGFIVGQLVMVISDTKQLKQK